MLARSHLSDAMREPREVCLPTAPVVVLIKETKRAAPALQSIGDPDEGRYQDRVTVIVFQPSPGGKFTRSEDPAEASVGSPTLTDRRDAPGWPS